MINAYDDPVVRGVACDVSVTWKWLRVVRTLDDMGNTWRSRRIRTRCEGSPQNGICAVEIGRSTPIAVQRAASLRFPDG